MLGLDFVLNQWAKCRCSRSWGDRILMAKHALNFILGIVVSWLVIERLIGLTHTATLFGGLAIGLGVALKDILTNMMVFFALVGTGQFRKGNILTMACPGMPVCAEICELNLLHVTLCDRDKKKKHVFVNNARFLHASFSIQGQDKRSGSISCPSKSTGFMAF